MIPVIFITIIIIILSGIVGIMINNKAALVNYTNKVFIFCISLCSLFTFYYSFSKNNLLLLMTILCYIILADPVFKQLKIPQKYNYRNVFVAIPFFGLLEIISFIVLPLKFIFLIFAVYSLFFLIVKIISRLSTESDDYSKTILYIILGGCGFIISINLFVRHELWMENVHFYLLGFNVLITFVFAYLFLQQISSALAVTTKKEKEKEINTQKLPSEKYIKSSLNDDMATTLLENLKNIDKIFFLNSSLKQEDLARELNTTKHHLSQVLNSKLNCNFHQYINAQRLEYVEAMLLKTDSDIETIILQCGFSSKVTFYRAFKKKHGISPGDFRKRYSKYN